MLCELHVSTNLGVVWLAISVAGLISMMLLSGSVFLFTHGYATHKTWQRKTIARYPEPERVATEIVQTSLGMFVVSVPAALAMWLAQTNRSKAYCGFGVHGWWYDILQTFVFWIGTDFYEFFYHYCGHKFSFMWAHHKSHHHFANPSPFAVIADGAMDNIMRGLPLLLYTLVMPTNMDILVFIFAVFFYAYGVYLHCGHELDWPNAETPFLNTSYYHIAHHAFSINQKPLHTGFFFRCWDELFGSIIPPPEIICAKKAREMGKRSLEAWQKLGGAPDYSVLLTTRFWLAYFKGDIRSDGTVVIEERVKAE